MSTRVASTSLLFVLVLAACATSPCPDGAVEQIVGATSYCVGRFSGVIITGFCRGSHPYELDLEGGVVCSATPLDPSAVPTEVCAVLDGRCAPVSRPLASGSWATLPDLPAPRASGLRTAAFCDASMVIAIGGDQDGGVRAVGAAALRATTSGWSDVWESMEGIVRFGGGGVAFGDETVLVYGDDAEDPPSLVARIYERASLVDRDVGIGAPSVRMEVAPVYEDGRFVVFGGRARYSTTAYGDGAVLDPASGTWAPTPVESAPDARSRHVSIGNRAGQVLIWGGSAEAPSFVGGTTGSAFGGGRVLDVATRRWLSLTAPDTLTPRTDPIAGFATDDEGALGWVIWGGSSASGTLLRDGAILDPMRTTWTPITLEGAPSRIPDQRGAVAGRWLFVVGGLSTDGYLPIALYDLTLGTWYELPPGPSARAASGVCATERSLIVVGGIDGTGHYLSDVWEWTP